MNLTDRFILTGLVPPARIPELVNAMDILVHPSRREGLARALPQGSLAGLPDITYDIDGNREACFRRRNRIRDSAVRQGQACRGDFAFDERSDASGNDGIETDAHLRRRASTARSWSKAWSGCTAACSAGFQPVAPLCTG